MYELIELVNVHRTSLFQGVKEGETECSNISQSGKRTVWGERLPKECQSYYWLGQGAKTMY